jgi:DNA processing protein
MLIERFGSAEAVLAAEPAQLDAVAGGRGVSRGIAEAIADPTPGRLLDLCDARGVRVVLEGDEAYPALLGRIDDPPGVLFVRGSFEPCDALAVAIVGSRHATA